MQTVSERINTLSIELLTLNNRERTIEGIVDDIKHSTLKQILLLEGILDAEKISQADCSELQHVEKLYEDLLHNLSARKSEYHPVPVSLIQKIQAFQGIIKVVLKKQHEFKEASMPLSEKGEINQVSKLTASEVDIEEARNDYGQTALHIAAAEGNTKTMLELLQAGANPNARDKRQKTPLHEAAYANQAFAMFILLKHHADPAAQEENGKTADQITQSEEIKYIIREFRSKPTALALPVSDPKEPLVTSDERRAIIRESKLASNKFMNLLTPTDIFSRKLAFFQLPSNKQDAPSKLSKGDHYSLARSVQELRHLFQPSI